MKLLNKNLDNYKALIFDLDGTLINSMPLHNKAWIEAFANNGVKVSEKFLQETAGMASPRIVSIVNERQNLNLDPKIVSNQKRQIYLKTLDQVEIFEPVYAIVRNFYKKVPLGIITGGSHAVVDQLLPKLKIDHYFDAIICSDDTKLGKDSREPYVLMGEKLSVKPQECVFFDDGDVGLKGASLAGMTIVHVDINHTQIFLN